ncbi:hypothetical protein J6590_100271, partial [Homalodisca vitripennis]
ACGEIQWYCLVGPIHSWCKSCVHEHCGYIIHWSDRYVTRVRSTVQSLWGDTVVLSGGSNSQLVQVMCACTLRLHNTLVGSLCSSGTFHCPELVGRYSGIVWWVQFTADASSHVCMHIAVT